MRTPRRRYAGHCPQTKPTAPLVDASGRKWNPEIYRTQEDGAPLLTSAGNYWLKPGKSHAE